MKQSEKIISESSLSTKSIFTLAEAAQFMGISKSTLYKMTANRIIEHYCPRGKQLYFTRESLERHMLQNRVPTRDEISQNVRSALGKQRNK